MLPLEIFYNLTGGEVKARWEWEEEDGGVNHELHTKSTFHCDKCRMSKKSEQHPWKKIILCLVHKVICIQVLVKQILGFSLTEGQATDFHQRERNN